MTLHGLRSLLPVCLGLFGAVACSQDAAPPVDEPNETAADQAGAPGSHAEAVAQCEAAFDKAFPGGPTPDALKDKPEAVTELLACVVAAEYRLVDEIEADNNGSTQDAADLAGIAAEMLGEHVPRGNDLCLELGNSIESKDGAPPWPIRTHCLAVRELGFAQLLTRWVENAQHPTTVSDPALADCIKTFEDGLPGADTPEELEALGDALEDCAEDEVELAAKPLVPRIVANVPDETPTSAEAGLALGIGKALAWTRINCSILAADGEIPLKDGALCTADAASLLIAQIQTIVGAAQ